MIDYADDVLQWLYSRPFQDNPAVVEPYAGQTFSRWDEWVHKGREIPQIESRLNLMLEQDKDPVNRSAAALALGFVGGDRNIKVLIKVLETDVPLVAMQAAASLGHLDGSEATESLCVALRNADANVRANACTALARLGGEKALSCLTDAVNDKDSFVQAAAKEALEALRRNK